MRSALYPFQLTSAARLRAVGDAVHRRGLHRLWLTESMGVDVLSAVCAVARDLPGLAFGSAVSLMGLHHPIAFAGRLRLLGELLPGRFAAGLGVSEPAVLRDVLGVEPPRSPLGYSREYLRILHASLTGPPTEVRGEHFSVHTNDLRDAPAGPGRPEVMLGALGPRMAGLAGAQADGCITWLVPPEVVADVIAPALRAAGGGRLVALVPCVPSTDAGEVHALARRMLGVHLTRPHYRRMLARAVGAGATDAEILDHVVHTTVAWGTPGAVGKRLRAYEDAGATEVAVAAYDGPGTAPGCFERTLDLAREC